MVPDIVDKEYLNTLIHSDSSLDDIGNQLLAAMKLAKKQGMLQKNAIDLLGSVLNDIDYKTDNALYETIMSVQEVVVGWCADFARI